MVELSTPSRVCVGMAKRKKSKGFFHQHSLSLVTLAILALWILLYTRSNPDTHWGAFFGNAVADWSGSVVIILGTKYLLEAHSADSRPVRGRRRNPLRDFVWRHSLLLTIAATGVGWLVLFMKMQPGGKWGQVVGNLLSEWTQMGGLVFLTKGLLEKGSEESR
ncbi:hypothetical protein K0B96_16795 [Horticoccus luteus]|uniref:Uncharacterized protein n=1 Tax=Horticoccus luteus TaxID=2862869 RepID=A0A8F9XLE2_9BACT|nr:hypothetical protein [Horticoccus luteus]QYM78939.1 hypothetical protein K0B96_16795 [Horticoccus luteus]